MDWYEPAVIPNTKDARAHLFKDGFSICRRWIGGPTDPSGWTPAVECEHCRDCEKCEPDKKEI